jgi:hypothetical protein
LDYLDLSLNLDYYLIHHFGHHLVYLDYYQSDPDQNDGSNSNDNTDSNNGTSDNNDKPGNQDNQDQTTIIRISLILVRLI